MAVYPSLINFMPSVKGEFKNFSVRGSGTSCKGCVPVFFKLVMKLFCSIVY